MMRTAAASVLCLVVLGHEQLVVDVPVRAHLQQDSEHNLKQPTNPSLHPESDKKFFGADYPNDQRPVPNADFSFNHPYPSVQATKVYNTDYVKDENGDKGEWKAQMDYDSLKSKVRTAEDEVAAAKAKEVEEREEYEKVVGKQTEAEETAKKAEKEAEEAREKAEKAEKEVDELASEKGRSKEDQDAEAETIKQATDDVEAAVQHLEGCKAALEKVRKQLDELVKEAEEKQEKKKGAAAEQENAKAKETSAKSKQTIARSEVAEQKEQHKVALKAYEKEKAEVDKAENDLKEAAAKLKKVRGEGGKPSDANSDQATNFLRSGASTFQLSTTVLPLVVAAIVALQTGL